MTTGRKEEVFRRAMNQGHSEAWDQRWDRAAEFYGRALEVIPDHPQALTSLGLALYEQQKFEDALTCYQRAAQVSPDDPLPIERTAQIYERTGRLNQAAEQSMRAADLYLKAKEVEKAIENWTRVTRLLPEHLSAHSRLALVHERLGRAKQSVTEYLAVASLLQHNGQLEEALQTVQHALSLAPDSREALEALELLRRNKSLPRPVRQRGVTGPLRMARVRGMEKEQAEKEDGRGGQSLDPIAEARQKALTILAGLLFDFGATAKQGDTEPRGIGSVARGVTGSLMSPGPDPSKIPLHLGQAVDLQTRGQDKEAIGQLQRAIDAGFDHPAAYFDLGLLLSNAGRKESALRSLQRSVQHADFNLAARLLIAEYLRKKGRLSGAVEEYLEALRAADAQVVPPEQAEELRLLYEPLIEALSQERDKKKLASLCENIHSLLMRPNWRAHLKQARVQLPGGEGAPPMPLAEILTQAESSRVVDVMAKINRLARQGFLRTAMEEAFVALDYAPTYLPLHIQIGELLIRQERNSEAIAKFNMVAQAYSSRGESERATDLFRRIVAFSPMDLAARTRLIDQFIGRGEIDEALAEFVQLGDVHYRLAELDAARTTYEKALRLAQQSKANRSWSVQILHHMADIDLQRLDWRKAVRVYEQLRTLEPEDEKARVGLIELNVRLGQDKKAMAELDNYLSYLAGNAKESQALSFLENLVQEHSELAFVRRRLAQVYQQGARREDAIAQWDQAGQLLLKAGDREGAKEAVRAILALKPPNAQKYQQFLRKLESG